MRNFLMVVIVAGLAWFVWNKQESTAHGEGAVAEISHDQKVVEALQFSEPSESTKEQFFACDGRTYCSQMTSCEEARYFLRNCPDVKMDGNNDGEPCESQWCGNKR